MSIEGREYRKLNLQLAFVAALVAIGLYYYSGSTRAFSDNVGVFVVPWVAVVIYFPVASVIAGLLETSIRFNTAGAHASWARFFGNTQPLLAKVLGYFGLVAVVYQFLSGGWSEVRALLLYAL